MHPSHPFWSQEVPRVDGQLLLTPCPGTQQVALPLALGQLKLAGAHGVLTLMTDAELARLELGRLGQQIEAAGMRWFQLPIEDDQAPDAPSRPPGGRLCQISSDCCGTASTWSSTARAAAAAPGWWRRPC